MRRQVHSTLPIPQEDVPATQRSDTEPGVGPVPRPNFKVISKMARKPAFRTPVFVRPQSERGITYGMDHGAENGLTPNVPLPVRSSLAQEVAVWRVQVSHYFARIAGATRYPGMAPGYPTAKVLTLVNTAPRMRGGNPSNIRGLRGYPARSGFMAAPPRFRKALPNPVNDYSPPIYGQ